MAVQVKIWLLAFRPKTLWAAVAPVLVGTALAAREGSVRPLVTVAILAAAVLIQVGANLANDVYDYLKGADTEGRLGPARVTARGLLAPSQVKAGMVLAFGVAIMIGFYLAWVGGCPIVVIGLASIAVAIAYTGGPWPLGYHGLGDLLVFLFFGVVAVYGAVYLHTDLFLPASLWGAIPMGALATAILVVNNYRDIDTDLRAGKRTLAVRLGRRGTRVEYIGLLVLAYLVPVIYMVADQGSPYLLLPLLTLPLAWVGGWPIVVIGLASIAVAIAYTAGPWPLGYHGLGDLLVFLFFGVVAVYGAVYLHTGLFLPASLWGAIPMGALATAILVVNNYRDIDTDLRAGKRTLAVRLGRRGTRVEYIGLLVLAYLVPVIYLVADQGSPYILLPLLTIPLAWMNIRSLLTTVEGGPLNTTLARTAGLQILYGCLFSLGLLL